MTLVTDVSMVRDMVLTLLMSLNGVACLILNRRYNFHVYQIINLNRVADKICHSVTTDRRFVPMTTLSSEGI